jgi:hypothetical protein
MDQRAQLTVDPPVRAWTRPAVLVPGFTLVALVGARFPAFSFGANATVVAAGAALCWLGAADRVHRRPAGPVSGSALWWLVPVGLLGGIELVNFALGSGYRHPTLSNLADPFLHRYPIRVVTYFGWLSGYWALVRR